jgi:xylulokinase
VRFRLSGVHATDVADASGTLLFDVSRRAWSEAMLELMDLPASLLPPAFESPEPTGVVSPEGAAATGLRAGTPLVAGGGDQAAGAVGIGIVRPGAVSATLGTSGTVFAATDRPARDPHGRVHTFCHAVPGAWHVMGVTQAAGLSLRWFRDQFGAGSQTDADGDPYDHLTAEAAHVAPGADGVLWAPYLMGERTPHLDPHARAALVGLAASHTRRHVIRAILEGVAFSLRDSFTILGEMGVPVTAVRLGGGGARSKVWRQIQADVYGQEVDRLQTDEGAAYGAALLAGVGATIWPSVEAACDAVVRVAERTAPDAAATRVMDQQYRAYRALYPALRQVREA